MDYLSTFRCLRRCLGVQEELYTIDCLLSFLDCPFLIALRYSLTFICIVDGDPVIRVWKLGSIYWFNFVTFLCPTIARHWISNATWRGLFVFNDLRWEIVVCFDDIGRMVDHHCLSFFSSFQGTTRGILR
jgi:hypothetical protein